jgi:hypothetical protein
MLPPSSARDTGQCKHEKNRIHSMFMKLPEESTDSVPAPSLAQIIDILVCCTRLRRRPLTKRSARPRPKMMNPSPSVDRGPSDPKARPETPSDPFDAAPSLLSASTLLEEVVCL